MVAVIELENGVRVYGNVIDAPMTSLYIGQPVRAQFEQTAAGGVHLGFTPTDTETP